MHRVIGQIQGQHVCVLVQMGRLISVENEGSKELDHLQQVVHGEIYNHCESAKEAQT